MAFVLGAAFGPHTTLVEVRDADTGALRATGQQRHRADRSTDDDPAAWWRSLVAAVSQTREREIAAISISGSHPGLVLLDGAGAVLRPRQPWQLADTAEHASRLRTTLGADRWARRAGAVPDANGVVARLAWLRGADPDTFGRIGAALLPHDWLTYRLTGRSVTDRGSASLTGAWSPENEDWLFDVLRELAPRGARGWWRERLPRVLGPSERADWLDAPVYDLLGLRGRPIVGPGTGADMATALALGLRPGRVGVSLGASTTALAALERPIIDPSGAVRSHADATGGHLAVVHAGDGGDLLDAVRELLDVDLAALLDLAAGADPLASGLTIVPEARVGAGAVVTGLGLGVSRGDLARAALDGIACAALDSLEVVVRAGGSWDTGEALRLAAPADRARFVAQLLADLSGRPVRATSGSSLAATGACIQAAAVLSGASPAEVASAWDLRDGPLVEPADSTTRAARRRAHIDERARQQRSTTEGG